MGSIFSVEEEARSFYEEDTRRFEESDRGQTGRCERNGCDKSRALRTWDPMFPAPRAGRTGWPPQGTAWGWRRRDAAEGEPCITERIERENRNQSQRGQTRVENIPSHVRFCTRLGRCNSPEELSVQCPGNRLHCFNYNLVAMP